jgi:protein-tyrosine phosphatase
VTFRLLHVCTGNICRSPMAERLTRAGLEARSAADAFVVASAGTWGLSGAPMDPSSQRALASYGLDGSDFRARQLVGYHVDEADLVLCATREHRAAAVTLAPDAGARSFTLREFARLTALVRPDELPAGGPEQRARALVALAAGHRGSAPPPPDPREDDLADPYRAPASAFAACAELVEHCLRRPLDLVAGPVAA